MKDLSTHATTKTLSVELLKARTPKKMHPKINQDVVDELKKLVEDPDYGPEFLDTYMDHLNVNKQDLTASPQKYLNAIKFFTQVESGVSPTNAYIAVFPDRYHKRIEKCNGDMAKVKAYMAAEASRFNNTKLVNEIRKAATVPIYLVHRHLLHEAILETATLMRTARSEMVRQRAADTLIKELKPPEDSIVTVDVSDKASSVIEELQKATKALATAEREALANGASIQKIVERPVIDVTPEVIEDD